LASRSQRAIVGRPSEAKVNLRRALVIASVSTLFLAGPGAASGTAQQTPTPPAVSVVLKQAELPVRAQFRLKRLLRAGAAHVSEIFSPPIARLSGSGQLGAARAYFVAHAAGPRSGSADGFAFVVPDRTSAATIVGNLRRYAKQDFVGFCAPKARVLPPLGQHAGFFFFYCSRLAPIPDGAITHAVVAWAYKNVTAALYLHYAAATGTEDVDERPDPQFIIQPREILATIRAQQTRLRKVVG